MWVTHILKYRHVNCIQPKRIHVFWHTEAELIRSLWFGLVPHRAGFIAVEQELKCWSLTYLNRLIVQVSVSKICDHQWLERLLSTRLLFLLSVPAEHVWIHMLKSNLENYKFATFVSNQRSRMNWKRYDCIWLVFFGVFFFFLHRAILSTPS